MIKDNGTMGKVLQVDNNFTPCQSQGGDELYTNGIFEFNITKILEEIQKTPDCFIIEEAVVSYYTLGFSSINESHLDSVDLSRPVILAEIAPDRYNLIDGHHRVEKARRLGIKKLSAYRLDVERHMKFLTSNRAYTAYIEYWNGKLLPRRSK